MFKASVYVIYMYMNNMGRRGSRPVAKTQEKWDFRKSAGRTDCPLLEGDRTDSLIVQSLVLDAGRMDCPVGNGLSDKSRGTDSPVRTDCPNDQ